MAEFTDTGAFLQLRHSTDMTSSHVVDDHLSDTSSDPIGKQHLPKSQLSFAEKKSLVFLCALYFIHALPLQFSWLTMPILLRQQVSYSALATFLVSQYPYSWKVVWSPLVDGFHFPWMGRRKTWVVPSFLAASIAIVWLAFNQDHLVSEVAAGRSFAMAWVMLAWFMVMFLCSNVRIALDSWSIDLLSAQNVHWASPVTTLGETLASLVSFNTFLGVASFTSRKDESGKEEPASTRMFFGSSALTFLITAVLLLLGTREYEKADKTQNVRKAYAIMWNILKLRHVWILMLVHVASMIGFITNDTITILQLVKNNFNDFELAGLATVALPFAIIGGFIVAKAFQTRHPLQVWRDMFPWRLALAFISQLTVLFISQYPDSHFRWLVVFLPFCLSAFFSAAMWVAFVAFHAQLSDPQYGGIYMSLLSTTLNIRYDTLQFAFTKIIGAIDGSEDLTSPSPVFDGYQIVNATAVVLAIPIYYCFLKPATLYLETIDVSEWRVKTSDSNGSVEYEMVGIRDEDDHHD